MSEPAKSTFSMRLRMLPSQLLLALVNGTAVLVIVAATLAMIASSRITNLAHNVASTMTDAVLSRVDENPRQVLQNIQRVSEDVRTLTAALTKARTEGIAGLDPLTARLNERLGLLEANLERLQGARSNLIDELIARVGSAVGDALRNFKGPSAPVCEKSKAARRYDHRSRGRPGVAFGGVLALSDVRSALRDHTGNANS